MIGPYKCIVMGDQRPASTELLERKVASLDRDTAWDAANQRPLTTGSLLARTHHTQAHEDTPNGVTQDH